MGKKVRVGVVGCGEIARRAHLPALLANQRVEVVGVCDESPDAASLVGKRFRLECPMYERMEGLLEAGPVDMVDICTPGSTHSELVTQALSANVNVLVEKPPALNPGEAREMVRMADDRGLKLGVVLNYRERDLIRQLRQWIEAGILGRVVKMQVVHHGPTVFGESRVLWAERTSKYLLYEFGIHFVDLLTCLFGPHEKVVYVAPIFRPDVALTTDLYAVIDFQSGTRASLEITADSTRHSSYLTQISVYGTGMDAFVRFFPPSIRLAAGLHNPIEVIREEVRSFLFLAAKILTGRYLAYRNLSHRRVVDNYVAWLLGQGEFETELKRVMPTVDLLAEIEGHIPSYTSSKP